MKHCAPMHIQARLCLKMKILIVSRPTRISTRLNAPASIRKGIELSNMLSKHVIIGLDTFKFMHITKSQFCCLYNRTKGKLDRKKTQAMLHIRPTKTRISSDSQSPGFTNKAVSKASQTNTSINRLLYRIINAERNIKWIILYVVHLIIFILNLFMLAPTRTISQSIRLFWQTTGQLYRMDSLQG